MRHSLADFDDRCSTTTSPQKVVAIMDTTTKKDPFAFKNPGLAVAAYLSAGVGLIVILGVTFCVLRRIRLRRAKKYIKVQGKRSIAMGPVLTSQPPSAPWKWKEVKANIKARRRGEERPYSGYGREPTISVIADATDGAARPQSANGVSRPQSANGVSRPQSANGVSRPQSATIVNRPQSVNGTTSLGPSHSKVGPSSMLLSSSAALRNHDQ